MAGDTDGGVGQYWLDGAAASTRANATPSPSGSAAYNRSASALAVSSSLMERGGGGSAASITSTSSNRGGTAASRNTRADMAITQQHNSSSSSFSSSPSMSSDKQGQTFTPPPRRLGSSLPAPFKPSRPTGSPSDCSPAFNSPSKYTHHHSSHQRQRAVRVLQYSRKGISELWHIVHPAPWSSSLHLTDQASWSLICYKLYVLSITIPPYSKLYFYYLPSCLLSDLVAILILQLGWWLIFGRYKTAGEEVERIGLLSSAPIIKNSTYTTTSSLDPQRQHQQSNLAIKDNHDWKSTLKNKVLLPLLKRTPFVKSYRYTALPFETSDSNMTNRSAFTTDPQTPANQSTRTIAPSTYSPNTGLGIDGVHTTTGLNGSEPEEGKGLLSTWREEEETPIQTSSVQGRFAIPSFGKGEEGDWKEEDVHYEDITLTQEGRGEDRRPFTEGSNHDDRYASVKKVEYDEELLRSALGTEKRTVTSMASSLIWIIFVFLHIIACLVAVVFTVIAIGAYSAGRVVFSWQGAFDSSSQTGYLFGYAMTEFPHFLATYATILGLGTGTMLLRCWIPRLIDNGTLSSAKVTKYIIPASKKIRIAIVSIVVIAFLSICAAVRPPKALPATDLLIDGVTATSAILLFKEEHTHPIALNANTTIYGQSNAFQPRLTPINTEDIKHVFFIFLESADYLAWPYQPDSFCKHRNCEDIDEKYNKVEEFTPFFNELIKNDKNTVFIENFRTNLAYTIKAHLASMCGILPHIHDYISSEADMDSPTACLPHILKALSDDKKGDIKKDGRSKNWKTGWFQAQMTAYDRQHEVIRREGFEEIWDSNTLTAKFGQKKEWTNYFGYADEELYPFLWDWIDDRLANNENIFMATAGATMHHPFTVPPWVEKTEYTKTEWTNNYLNVVKRTDRDLKLFFDGLKSRNLLDKSLIIMQGDHGPRIGEDGVYVDNGWQEHIYRSPLAIRAPGLLPHQIEQDPIRPYIALDILPTILDALGVKPSIIKSFVGQSILRGRSQRHLRDSYHAQSRGGQYPHHLRTLRHNTYKAVRMEHGDTCVTDVNVDPTETFFYCVTEGWRKVFEGEELKDGISKGLWKEGSKEEKKLIDYANEAKTLMDNHLEVNKDFWNVEKHKVENEELKEKFLAAIQEQSHWH